MESTAEVGKRIAEDALLSAILGRVTPLISGDPSHDLGHSFRVALWAVRLGGDQLDERSAIAAALLHDAVFIPKDSPNARRASDQASVFARELLSELSADGGFSIEEIEAICDAIRDHSYSRGVTPQTLLGKVLQDADRLEALGAIGLIRAVSVGVQIGSAWFDPEDPLAERRDLDEKRYIVDHFFTKLLRLPETMHTDKGRAEAERRVDFLRSFLVQLGDEVTSRVDSER